MKIISWNINGVNAWSQKEGVFDFLNQENPDIFCVQELKTSVQKMPNILENFPFHFYHFAKKPGYSGVAIFSKQKPITQEFKIIDTNDEGRIMTLEFEDFFLINVYSPNSKIDLSRLDYRKNIWDKFFLEYVNSLKEKKEIIICGDLNVLGSDIDLQNFEFYFKDVVFKRKIMEERKGFMNILNSGFTDSYRFLNPEKIEYSWFAPKALGLPSIRLDYFLLTSEILKKLEDSRIVSQFGSDHIPIILDLKIDFLRNTEKKVQKKIFPDIEVQQNSLF